MTTIHKTLKTLPLCLLIATLGCQVPGSAAKDSQIKYRVPSDTVHVFGNGRFQVAKVYKRVPKGFSISYGLFDSTSPSGIAMNVSGWGEKGKFGYVAGEEGFQPSGKVYHQKYFLIYLPTNKLTKYPQLSKVPAKHRQEFSHLQQGKRRGE